MKRNVMIFVLLLAMLIAVRRPLLAQMNPVMPNGAVGENADQRGNADQTTQPDNDSGNQQQANPDDPGNNGDAADPDQDQDQDQNNNDADQANADGGDAQPDDGDAGQ